MLRIASVRPGAGFFELPAKLLWIDAVLRRFMLTNIDNRNIPAVALGEFGIKVNIDFPESAAKFEQ